MSKPLDAKPLQIRHILLGVGGSIAAYKALEIVRRFRSLGIATQVVMTQSAERFVTPLSFQALSGYPTRTCLWDSTAEQAMGHLELAQWADLLVLAPATANMIARLAHGLADDLLSTLCLASVAPLVIAPAMNYRMWLHPATQTNVRTLLARGVTVIGPDDGPLAEDASGPGRMVAPEQIVRDALASAHRYLSTTNAGQKIHARVSDRLFQARIVISAGPTFEDIDPVRYVCNRSSGKMGFALANAAIALGAEVVLVAGPVHLPTPSGVAQRIDVRSAAQMRDAVLRSLPADIYIGTAAIADYTPTVVHTQKIKKSGDTLLIECKKTPDVLFEVAAQTDAVKYVVGFAAETQHVERYAMDKLQAKQLDMIVSNQVGVCDAGFESDTNKVTALWQGGKRSFPHTSKTALAHQLLHLIAERMQI